MFISKNLSLALFIAVFAIGCHTVEGFGDDVTGTTNMIESGIGTIEMNI